MSKTKRANPDGLSSMEMGSEEHINRKYSYWLAMRNAALKPAVDQGTSAAKRTSLDFSTKAHPGFPERSSLSSYPIPA